MLIKEKDIFRNNLILKEKIYLKETVSDYLIDYQFKINSFLFVDFFSEDVNYENFITKKRSAKIIKFILNNSVVNYDIITKDFISRLLHPSGSSYILFKLNYKIKNQFFNRFELVKKKRISLFDEYSFFSSVSSIIRGAFVFYYKKRFGGIKALGTFSLARRFNRRFKKLFLLFYIRKYFNYNNNIFWQIKLNLRFKEYFWIKRKINFGLINYKNKYLFKRVLSNNYKNKHKKLKSIGKSSFFFNKYMFLMMFFKHYLNLKTLNKNILLKRGKKENWRKIFL